MTRLDAYLLVVVAAVGLAAVSVQVPRREAKAIAFPRLDDIPNAVGTWHGAAVGDDDVLPVDARSVDSIRRRYDGASGSVWVGVARYPARNAPELRPALDALVPASGIRSMTREAVHIPLGNGRTLPAIRRSIRYPTRTLTLWYWYHVGPRVVADEYRLRLRLGVDNILGHQHPLFLVRIASIDHSPTELLAVLLPQLDGFIARADGGRS